MMTLAVSLLVLAGPPEDAVKELGLPEVAGLPATLPKKYLPDDVTPEVVRKAPGKYIFRAAVLDAADALAASHKLRPIRSVLETRVETEKKSILDFQEDLASAILELDEAAVELERAAAKRQNESSARWQAHLDYLLAAVKFRSATLEELNLAYGSVHRNELPKVEPKHNGWTLAAAEKMHSKAAIRRQVEEARDAFEAVRKAHPDTPWAKLAERDMTVQPGLKWESAEVKPPPPKIEPKKKRP